MRQIVAVGTADDLPAGVATEEPRREPSGGQLGFPVTGRAEDHQAIDLASFQGFELFGDQSVMMRGLKDREGVKCELDQTLSSSTPVEEFGGGIGNDPVFPFVCGTSRASSWRPADGPPGSRVALRVVIPCAFDTSARLPAHAPFPSDARGVGLQDTRAHSTAPSSSFDVTSSKHSWSSNARP